jgi:apolipoprotein N-acyltransferase
MFWRNCALSITGGLLAAFSFPNPIWIGLSWPGGFLAFFCLIPLLLIREPERGMKTWRWGLLYGFVYFGISIWWMASMKSMWPLSPLAWFLLSLYCAWYPALFLWIYHRLLERGVPKFSLAIILWVSLEFLRNYMISGFPWVILGYAHYQNPLMMALAPVAGVWGLSFITVSVNVLLYAVAIRFWPRWRGQETLVSNTSAVRPRRIHLSVLVILALLLCVGAVYETWQYQNTSALAPVKMGVLQGNINQNQTWDEDYVRKTFTRYSGLIEKAVQEEARLVVWPETAFPGIFNYDYHIAETVRGWSRQWDLTQLIGADEVETSEQEGYDYYNSIFLLNPAGKIRGRVSKKHLVPFGEYVPYKDSIFFFIHKIVRRYGGAGFTPGKERVVLPWNEKGRLIPVGALICFESIFPRYAAKLCRLGGQVLVVITNDTWFGHSAAAAQHAIFSAFRAAETGRYLLRAATSGVSVIFGPHGTMHKQIAIDQAGYAVEEINPRTHLTLYARFGNWICWICVFMLFFDFLPILREKYLVLWRRNTNGLFVKIFRRKDD